MPCKIMHLIVQLQQIKLSMLVITLRLMVVARKFLNQILKLKLTVKKVHLGRVRNKMRKITDTSTVNNAC